MFLPGSSTAPIVRGTAEAAAMGPRGKGRREQGGVRPKCPFLFTSQLAASQQVLVASYCNRGASNPCGVVEQLHYLPCYLHCTSLLESPNRATDTSGALGAVTGPYILKGNHFRATHGGQ